jgi:hypothetical protein
MEKKKYKGWNIEKTSGTKEWWMDGTDEYTKQ